MSFVTSGIEYCTYKQAQNMLRNVDSFKRLYSFGTCACAVCIWSCCFHCSCIRRFNSTSLFLVINLLPLNYSTRSTYFAKIHWDDDSLIKAMKHAHKRQNNSFTRLKLPRRLMIMIQTKRNWTVHNFKCFRTDNSGNAPVDTSSMKCKFQCFCFCCDPAPHTRKINRSNGRIN